jgi:hypothetical protein
MAFQFQSSRPMRGTGRRRAGAVVASVATHAGLLAALILSQHEPPQPPELAPINVSLIEGLPQATSPIPQAVAPTPPTTPVSRPSKVRVSRAPPEEDSLPADDTPTQGVGAELTEAQLAGAASAGDAPSGRECDMPRRLQAALRRDTVVQAAVAEAARSARSAGAAIMVWNGDWVQSASQDGKGLAAVREAISWEVAFAPKACRAETEHGLILLSLNAAPGSMRLAVGGGDWRWGDLLRTNEALSSR